MNLLSTQSSAVDPFSGVAMPEQVEFRFSFATLLRSVLLLTIGFVTGCNFIPDIKRKPQHHNPFPQISKVAILPFRNQSQEPTLSGARVSMAYYNELQAIRGFEVIPCGVVENQLTYFETQVLRHPISSPVDFQQFAKYLGVDAVLQGAITDYSAYYPPRMAMKVNWYAANPGFHPIPVGYGLPWGTKKEKNIPEWVRLESERSLAAEQMKTQTPDMDEDREAASGTAPGARSQSRKKGSPSKSPLNEMQSDEMQSDEMPPVGEDSAKSTQHSRIPKNRIALKKKEFQYSETDEPDDGETVKLASAQEPARMPESIVAIKNADSNPPFEAMESSEAELAANERTELPANWPDPQGFIPRKPSATPPELVVQYEPIISHMRTYNGNDEDFTHALGEYYYFRDDARFGGWQSYLQRSEDFIRFCCHQHIVETLESRGGSLESRLILRWPINRYER
jgi:hypothetical protein